MASPRRVGAAKPRKLRAPRKPRTSARKPTSARGSKKRESREEARLRNDAARPHALAIARVGIEHRALDVEIIDVRGKVDYADYVIVMAGRSDRQVGALVRHISEAMEREAGVRCLAVEGMPRATWVLMDFGDVIVHLFHQDTRGYYDIESLFIDAARVPVDARP